MCTGPRGGLVSFAMCAWCGAELRSSSRKERPACYGVKVMEERHRLAWLRWERQVEAIRASRVVARMLGQPLEGLQASHPAGESLNLPMEGLPFLVAPVQAPHEIKPHGGHGRARGTPYRVV